VNRGGIFEPDRLELSEVVNALLDKGVVIRGEADISVADVDLIRLDLGALLVAVETALRQSRGRTSLAASLGPAHLTTERKERPREAESVTGTARGDGTEERAREEVSLRTVAPALPERINVDPAGAENGLARLALTLIEVLRKVLEHQAIRRMEGGSLTGQEIERLGQGLLRLHDQMDELKKVFGITDEDLQVDLGPLGRVR
jgi:hypothetical protein